MPDANAMPPFSAIVLAAGKGTRMRSEMPKVMHAVAGLPMLGHVLSAAADAGASETVVVVAPQMDAVRDFAETRLPGCRIAVQEEQLGTGHAVSCGVRALIPDSVCLILYGDTPLIRGSDLRHLLAAGRDGLVVLGMTPADPTGYGRLVTQGHHVEAIVEEKDADALQRQLTLCNSGIMALPTDLLRAWLPEIGTRNASGEYYLTDLVGIAWRKGNPATYRYAASPEAFIGVNTRAQLAVAEAAMQATLRRAAMEGGATLIDPASVHFAYDTVLGRDVVVEPNVFFGPGVTIGNDVHIRAFSHLEGANVAEGAIVGPYARLRPGAVVGEQAHVGNFVEIKNATLGAGAKANHLSYLGDAGIGAGSNIGAGTITCNYDGFSKHRTEIGEGVFVGSNTALVAPVTVGDGAIIGAGSTITRDVPGDALVVARAETTVKENGATAFREWRGKQKG